MNKEQLAVAWNLVQIMEEDEVAIADANAQGDWYENLCLYMVNVLVKDM